MDDIDPRAAKLLGDLLALALADNDAQAEVALAALRRRASAEGVSGGAMKRVVEQVLGGLGGASRSAQDEVHQLRWMLDDQRRELNETRTARQRAEAALARSERARLALEAGAEATDAGRRTGMLVAFLGGLALAGVAAIGFVGLGGASAAGGLDRVAKARLADDLHACFLASSNSLVGSPFPLRVEMELDADGRISGAQWAPEQSARVVDMGRRTYGEMVIRTFAGGSCGALALPASLRGRPQRLELMIPR